MHSLSFASSIHLSASIPIPFYTIPFPYKILLLFVFIRSQKLFLRINASPQKTDKPNNNEILHSFGNVSDRHFFTIIFSYFTQIKTQNGKNKIEPLAVCICSMSVICLACRLLMEVNVYVDRFVNSCWCQSTQRETGRMR